MIRDLKRFVKGVEWNHGNDGAEDFFLSDAHRGSTSAKIVGSWNQPLERLPDSARCPPTTSLASFALSDLDILHNGLQLRFVDQRSDFCFGVKPIADFEGPHALREAVEKFSIHFVVNGDAAGGRAALSTGAESAHTAPSTASSRFASSITMMMFLPPISRWHGLNEEAQAWLTRRPVSVEPVKLTAATSS